MSGFEWFLLVVVVIAVPLVVAGVVTLWTLEQARQRNRKNRDASDPEAGPVKRQASRSSSDPGVVTVVSSSDSGSCSRQDTDCAVDAGSIDATPDASSSGSGGDGDGAESTSD